MVWTIVLVLSFILKQIVAMIMHFNVILFCSTEIKKYYNQFFAFHVFFSLIHKLALATVATQLSRTLELQDCKFREVIKNKHSFHISSKIICKTNMIAILNKPIINWIEGGQVECGYTPKTPKCWLMYKEFLHYLYLF